jgi:hypothetical protein
VYNGDLFISFLDTEDYLYRTPLGSHIPREAKCGWNEEEGNCLAGKVDSSWYESDWKTPGPAGYVWQEREFR